MYKFQPLGVRRDLITDIDQWFVYVATMSQVEVPIAALWQAFRRQGWTYERFKAAVDGLHRGGQIEYCHNYPGDFVTLECPLKD